MNKRPQRLVNYLKFAQSLILASILIFDEIVSQGRLNLLARDVVSLLGVRALLVPQQEITLLAPKHSFHPSPSFTNCVL